MWSLKSHAVVVSLLYFSLSTQALSIIIYCQHSPRKQQSNEGALQPEEVFGLHRCLRKRIPQEWKSLNARCVVKQCSRQCLSDFHQCYTDVVRVYDRPYVWCCWMRAVSLILSCFFLSDCMNCHWHIAVCRGWVGHRNTRQKHRCFLGGRAGVEVFTFYCLTDAHLTYMDRKLQYHILTFFLKEMLHAKTHVRPSIFPTENVPLWPPDFSSSATSKLRLLLLDELMKATHISDTYKSWNKLKM